MKIKGLCYGCNLPIEGAKHYHDTVPAGSALSSTCRELNTAREARQRQAIKRTQAAKLNGGVELGKHNKELMARLAPLVIRSYGDVAKIMNLSPEGVRLIELRALSKIRAALLPFRGALSGEAKIKQVTQPIASLSD